MESRIFVGDALDILRTFPAKSVHTCVTSPPYWGLRDYGIPGQLGLEKTPEEYIAKLVEVFREVRRVLRDDGTLWLNLGDSFNSRPGKRKANDKAGEKQKSVRGSVFMPSRNVAYLKPKDLVGIPWLVAFALRADGWYLRSDIIWHKPNAMPESVRDRPTKAHEYIFLLAKSAKYYYDAQAVREPFKPVSARRLTRKWNGNRARGFPGGVQNNFHRYNGTDEAEKKAAEGRNKRSVWTVSTKSFKGAHFATFPPDLIEPCVLAGSPTDGIVLDPFFGAGTTGQVAARHNRRYIGIELNPEYADMASRRIEASNNTSGELPMNFGLDCNDELCPERLGPPDFSIDHRGIISVHRPLIITAYGIGGSGDKGDG